LFSLNNLEPETEHPTMAYNTNLSIGSRPYSLLITESAEQFEALSTALDQELAPSNAIQHHLVGDLPGVLWEIQRLQRSRAGIVNNAYLAALKTLICQFLPRENFQGYLDLEKAADKLAHGWFASLKGKARVRNILRKFHLDETAIEAEAMRLASPDLERLDRALMMQEKRRDRLLAQVADSQQRFAAKNRASDRLIDEPFPYAVTVDP
jgi:hypothetical protein